jgi:hypothetical protein
MTGMYLGPALVAWHGMAAVAAAEELPRPTEKKRKKFHFFSCFSYIIMLPSFDEPSIYRLMSLAWH